MKKILTNITLFLLSLVIGLGAVEFLSRWSFPVAPGVRHLDQNGDMVAIGTANPFRHKPGRVRQQANEFSVSIGITTTGYRVPEVEGNPDIVFIGDSFTFGQGLEDDETFVAIYCTKLKIQCANLGQSGAGTALELDILEHFLMTENWRPGEVKLFVMAMTGALMSGNDLADNLEYRKLFGNNTSADKPVFVPPESRKYSLTLPDVREFILANSNLLRIVYFYAAPIIRASFSPRPEESQLEKALKIMEAELARFRSMSDKYGFTPKVYLLHPIQDLVRETAAQTLADIRNVAPNDLPVIATYHAFTEIASAYYYPYDGHFNPVGARAIADLLLSEQKKP
jgi:hypothetical protein